MLVEHDSDIKVIEYSGYKGIYLITGVIYYSDPNPSDSSVVKYLKEFLKNNEVKEIILAFSANPDGEFTADIIAREISNEFPKIKISGFARGLSTGLEIGYF